MTWEGALVPGQRELPGGPLWQPVLAPWAHGPCPWAWAPRLPEWPPHHSPESQTSQPDLSLTCVAGAPDLGSSDCLAVLPSEPGPFLVLFQPSGPALATARGGRWGMFLPSCVEPSTLGLGLQTPADHSQWTRSGSQNTPNRWAEFPGRQRTDNLVGGAGGEEG